MNLKGLSLLVIDDDALLRRVVASHFEDFNCKILQASNSREAVHIMQSEPVHLVISDIRMPGGSGVEFLEELQAIGIKLPPIILMTGFVDFPLETLYKKGATAILTKPFVWEDLIKLVKVCLQK